MPNDLDSDGFDEDLAAAAPKEKPKAKAPPKSKPNGADPDPGDRWLDSCQLDSHSNPIPNLHNVLLALRNDPAWVGTIGFDEMQQVPVLRGSGAAMEDIDAFRVREWMQAHSLRKIGIEDVRQAIEIVAREYCFHRLREQLDEFADQWDGTPRLTDFLSTYFGTIDDEYHRQVSVKFLVGMAARIYQPGCKLDTMLVLEGPQGILKSQAIQALAGEYFSDTLPDLSRDPIRVSMHLRGKWLIEVSELSAFSRAEAAHLKQFLSSPVEQYTPKHARKEVREPRQCLFVGTTNKQAYLQDETGARRFWPVKCGTIDLPRLKAERPQILGEAVLEFRRGAPWWADDKLQALFFTPVQDARFDGSAWEKVVEEWDRSVWDPDAEMRVNLDPPFYLADIARGALRIDPGKLTKADEMRLATVLDTAGWTRATKTRFGRPWFPPP